jgi:hypothetical protein
VDSSAKESNTFNCQASNFILVLVGLNYERKDRTARGQITMGTVVTAIEAWGQSWLKKP